MGSIFSKAESTYEDQVHQLHLFKNFEKPFQQLFLGKRLCLNILQEITAFTNMIDFTFLRQKSSH